MNIPRKFTQNVIVDSIALVAFIFLTTTGVLMKYILPPGSGRNTGIWGFDRHAWGDLHFWVAIIMFGALALHLFLHWNWIVGVFKGKKKDTSGNRFLLGLLGLVTVIALSIAPLVSPKQSAKGTEYSKESEMHSDSKGDEHLENEGDFYIRGSMTLAEIVAVTNVSKEYIIEKLELPEDISDQEKIGQLRSQYGFSMDEVRKIIQDYSLEKKSD